MKGKGNVICYLEFEYTAGENVIKKIPMMFFYTYTQVEKPIFFRFECVLPWYLMMDFIFAYV